MESGQTLSQTRCEPDGIILQLLLTICSIDEIPDFAAGPGTLKVAGRGLENRPMSLGQLLAFGSQDVAIDLGTANTIVYVRDRVSSLMSRPSLQWK